MNTIESDLLKKIGELGKLQERKNRLKTEEKEDPQPQAPYGRINYYETDMPEGYDEAMSEYSAKSDARHQRWCARAEEIFSIDEERESLKEWIITNGSQHYKSIYRHLSADSLAAKALLDRFREIKNPEKGGSLFITKSMDPFFLYLEADATRFLTDYIVNQSNPSGVRLHAVRQLARVKGVPNLDKIVTEIIESGNDQLFMAAIEDFKDPRVILPVYDHPEIKPSPDFHHEEHPWKEDPHSYTSELVFYEIGKGAIPVLMEVMTSRRYPDHLREHAVRELREINDPDTNSRLLEMMDGEHVKYAAKALVKSEDPRKVDAFFAHWEDIDYLDWVVGLTLEKDRSEPVATQISVDTLVAKDTDPKLKQRCVDLLLRFGDYKLGRTYKGTIHVDEYPKFYSARISAEQHRKLFDYYLQQGYQEDVPFSEMLVRLDRRDGKHRQIIIDFHEIARDRNRDTKLRVQLIKTIGSHARFSHYPWSLLYGHYGENVSPEHGKVEKYLKHVGSRLIGWLVEPDTQIRIAAREAYKNCCERSIF